MVAIKKRFKPELFFLLFTLVFLLLAGGCARYSRTVNTLYEPSADIRGGSGDVYIVIPENSRTSSTDMKWSIGKVKDDDNKNIDEIYSPRSPAEILQSAFSMEFKKGGYTAMLKTKRPENEKMVIDITKSEIDLEQITDIVDIKAKCRVMVGVDIYRNGQLIKRLQYESTSTRTDVKDRDILAGKVLDESLKSVMLKAMPELHGLSRQ